MLYVRVAMKILNIMGFYVSFNCESGKFGCKSGDFFEWYCLHWNSRAGNINDKSQMMSRDLGMTERGWKITGCEKESDLLMQCFWFRCRTGKWTLRDRTPLILSILLLFLVWWVFVCIGACCGFCGCTNQRIANQIYVDIFGHIKWCCSIFLAHSPNPASHVFGMTQVIRYDYSTLFFWPTSTCFDLCNGHQYIILWRRLFLRINSKFKLKTKLNIFHRKAHNSATELNERHYFG